MALFLCTITWMDVSQRTDEDGKQSRSINVTLYFIRDGPAGFSLKA